MDIKLRQFTIGRKMNKRQELIDEMYHFYNKDASIIPSLQKLINEKGMVFVERTFREISKEHRSWKYLVAVLSRAEIQWQ